MRRCPMTEQKPEVTRTVDEIMAIFLRRMGTDESGLPLTKKYMEEAVRLWLESGEPLYRLPDMLRDNAGGHQDERT